MKYIRWIGWLLYYHCWYKWRPVNSYFEYLNILINLVPPWRVNDQRPSIWHNDDGKYWMICFRNETGYCRQVTVTTVFDVYFSSKDNKVIGIDIPDKLLDAI
jgi:hypothetical protein